MTMPPLPSIETLALQYDDGSLNVLPPGSSLETARAAARWGDDSIRPDIVRVRVETIDFIERAEEIE